MSTHCVTVYVIIYVLVVVGGSEAGVSPTNATTSENLTGDIQQNLRHSQLRPISETEPGTLSHQQKMPTGFEQDKVKEEQNREDLHQKKSRKFKRETNIDDRTRQSNVNGQSASGVPCSVYRVMKQNNHDEGSQLECLEENSANGTKVLNETVVTYKTKPKPTLQPFTIHRERNHQILLEIYVYNNTKLNDSLEIDWKYTEHFPNVSELGGGENDPNSTGKNVERKTDGSHYLKEDKDLKLLLSESESFSAAILEDRRLLETWFTKFAEAKIIFAMIRYAPKITTNDTNTIDCFNISQPHNISSGQVLKNGTGNNTNESEVGIGNLKDILIKYNFTGYFMLQWNNVSDLISEGEICFQMINSGNQTVKERKLKLSRLGEVLRDYMYPIVYVVFLIFGVIGNGTLLMMFFRHKELRTDSNVMIINLVVVDLLNLFVNVPIYYVTKYYSEWIYLGGYGCRTYSSFRYMIHTVIMLTIVALSAQRYCATIPLMGRKERRCTLPARWSNVIYVSTVWIVSLLRGVPSLFVFEFKKGTCFPLSNSVFVQVLNILYFIIFCVVLPVTMSIFSSLTAKRLRKSVREIPGVSTSKSREMSRYRSAKVVTALAIVYAVCFGPRFVWVFMMSYFRLDRRLPQFVLIDELTNYLMIPNSCLNPLALYIASGTFRRYFRIYLFPYRKTDKTQKNPPLERKITTGTTSSSCTPVEFLSSSVSAEVNSTKDL